MEVDVWRRLPDTSKKICVTNQSADARLAVFPSKFEEISMNKEHWKDQPDEHDFPAATDYLSLVFTPDEAAKMVTDLRVAPLTHRKAKDLLRASRLELLPPDNVHVAKDLSKVKSGQRLSPILLVRGRGRSDVPLIVGDGYHRICASYDLDEDADIPCRIVDAT